MYQQCTTGNDVLKELCSLFILPAGVTISFLFLSTLSFMSFFMPFMSLMYFIFCHLLYNQSEHIIYIHATSLCITSVYFLVYCVPWHVLVMLTRSVLASTQWQAVCLFLLMYSSTSVADTVSNMLTLPIPIVSWSVLIPFVLSIQDSQGNLSGSSNLLITVLRMWRPSFISRNTYIRPVKEHLISEDCWECMDVSCVFNCILVGTWTSLYFCTDVLHCSQVAPAHWCEHQRYW